MKFRKKPVVIDAVQWQTGAFRAPDWLADAVDAHIVTRGDGGVALIHTSEGVMTGQVGDWIIRGVKGELYPCKPDIFAATYEPADPGVPRSGVPLDLDAVTKRLSEVCYGYRWTDVLALADEIRKLRALSSSGATYSQKGIAMTPGPYAQGVTLVTAQTRRWSKEQIAKNDAMERCLVLAQFNAFDEGRSRVIVAQCQREEDAAFIVASCNREFERLASSGASAPPDQLVQLIAKWRDHRNYLLACDFASEDHYAERGADVLNKVADELEAVVRTLIPPAYPSRSESDTKKKI